MKKLTTIRRIDASSRSEQVPRVRTCASSFPHTGKEIHPSPASGRQIFKNIQLYSAKLQKYTTIFKNCKFTTHNAARGGVYAIDATPCGVYRLCFFYFSADKPLAFTIF